MSWWQRSRQPTSRALAKLTRYPMSLALSRRLQDRSLTGAGRDVVQNIRRRVYDALNVLRAMNIIAKHKNKEIHWVSLPETSSQQEECKMLESERAQLQRSIEQKKLLLRELFRQVRHEQARATVRMRERERALTRATPLQLDGYNKLLKRNSKAPALPVYLTLHPPGDCPKWFDLAMSFIPLTRALFLQQDPKKIQLPFILVNTAPEAVIDCEVADDKSEYRFIFSMPFQMHDDAQILQKMGFYPDDDAVQRRLALFQETGEINEDLDGVVDGDHEEEQQEHEEEAAPE